MWYVTSTWPGISYRCIHWAPSRSLEPTAGRNGTVCIARSQYRQYCADTRRRVDSVHHRWHYSSPIRHLPAHNALRARYTCSDHQRRSRRARNIREWCHHLARTTEVDRTEHSSRTSTNWQYSMVPIWNTFLRRLLSESVTRQDCVNISNVI